MAYPVTVEWEEDGEGATVTCPEDLGRLLDRLASETDLPALVMINNEGGSLAIGVGAPVGTLNHVPPSRDPPT